jgi:hypothetical protein
LGATLTKAHVGIVHAGVCALAAGRAMIETAKVKAKSKANTVVFDLSIENFMYFSFSFFSVRLDIQAFTI